MYDNEVVVSFSCKPGWCGAGPAKVPLSVSAPMSTSNKGAVTAATSAVDGAAGGAGAGMLHGTFVTLSYLDSCQFKTFPLS